MKRPNRLYRGAWIPLLLLLAAGCVMPDQVSQMQNDLADVRRQLGEVRQSQDESARRLTELVGAGAERIGEVASIPGDLVDVTGNGEIDVGAVAAEQVVAAIEKAMHGNCGRPARRGQAHGLDKMIVVAVHTTRRKQAHDVHGAAAGPGGIDR